MTKIKALDPRRPMSRNTSGTLYLRDEPTTSKVGKGLKRYTDVVAYTDKAGTVEVMRFQWFENKPKRALFGHAMTIYEFDGAVFKVFWI